jgi:hypothetical protein
MIIPHIDDQWDPEAQGSKRVGARNRDIDYGSAVGDDADR